MLLWMVVAVCITIAAVTGFLLIYRYHTNPHRLKLGPEWQEEMKGLREEVSQLRRQNNDVILALDHTLRRLEQRMEPGENHVLPVAPVTQPEPERQFVGR